MLELWKSALAKLSLDYSALKENLDTRMAWRVDLAHDRGAL